MVADAVRAAGQHPTRTAVTVTISDADNVLRVRLSTTGLDAAASELVVAAAQDRIAAANGSLTLTSSGGQTTLEAVIPCAS
jgi:hypothetical protein